MPSYLSPYGSHKDKLIERQQWILDSMEELGYITAQELNDAKNEDIRFQKQNENITAAHFVMFVREQLVEKLGEAQVEEGGLDVAKSFHFLKKAIQRLQKGGIPVSLFVDPRSDQIKASEGVGANEIEIHTGHYCDAKTMAQADEELKKILDAVGEATHRNLQIAAGHGLNYVNVQRIAEIKEIEELNIGHSIISRAIAVGMRQAVREMLDLIK